MKTERHERDYETQVREFPHKDTKGRRVGARALTFMVEYSPVDPEKVSKWFVGYSKPPGVLYGWRPHALRDGKPYGAAQATSEYASEAERTAAIARYFAGAEKRARKLAEPA